MVVGCAEKIPPIKTKEGQITAPLRSIATTGNRQRSYFIPTIYDRGDPCVAHHLSQELT